MKQNILSGKIRYVRSNATLQPDNKILSDRYTSIDLLRGVVMVIMALDHARLFLHSGSLTVDALNMSTTTPALFFTRWITHFCAPVFVFLAGTSIFIQSNRKSKAELSTFLIKRGLWFIAVDIVVMSFAFTFDITFSSIILQVIWAIGISMILMAGFIWMPFSAVLSIGLLIVVGHNLLDGFDAAYTGNGLLWNLIYHFNTNYPINDSLKLMIYYPFMPWLGIMMLGYGLGKLYNKDINSKKRFSYLFSLGVLSTCLFIVLRFTNFYGNPKPWAEHSDPIFTLMSFLNTQKYPPSLLFIAMTVGPSMIFLAFADRIQNQFSKIISVYGRVPFFYYILHFYVLHTVAMLLFLSRGHSVSDGVNTLIPFKFLLPGEGVSLGVVYTIWIAVVVLLYPLCKMYDRYKTTHKNKRWLSYL